MEIVFIILLNIIDVFKKYSYLYIIILIIILLYNNNNINFVALYCIALL